MSSNHPLFDRVFAGTPEPTGPPLTGKDLRDSGIEAVLQHTPESYKQAFINTIKDFPKGYCFTVEDVREKAGDPPKEVHYNCIGGLIRTAAGMNLITRTVERRKAKRASLHASELAVWRRL